MATCPKCFQEKPMLATHCPQCTHRTEVGDQIIFSVLAGLGQLAFLIWIFSVIFG